MDKGGYQIRDQSKPHFITFTVVDWDGPTFRGIFTRKVYRDVIIESMKFCPLHDASTIVEVSFEFYAIIGNISNLLVSKYRHQIAIF
jgi:hypothetical protein